MHEIKHDGYRLIVRRTDDRVRLLTRRGYDWTKRFPRVVDAVKRLRVNSIALDGEAVVCGEDGVSDFNRLHSQSCDEHVFLYAFDLSRLQNGTGRHCIEADRHALSIGQNQALDKGQEPKQPRNAAH